MDNNGLRDENGALIGGLEVLEYNQGIEDFKNGVPPPDRETSPSYDLGRQRAAEKIATDNEVRTWLDRQSQETDARLRSVLTAEQYEEYRKQVDAATAKNRPDSVLRR